MSTLDRLATGTIILPNDHRAQELREPVQLLGSDNSDLRSSLVRISDEALGTDTSALWEGKFTADFLASLCAFFLIKDRNGRLLGWSGFRTGEAGGQRVVYFTSIGLLPLAQGQGLVPALQRHVIGAVMAEHPGTPAITAVRTRNPHSYRMAAKTFGTEPLIPSLDGTVPWSWRDLVGEIAAWLGLTAFDPATARIAGAYPMGGPLYAREPRTGDPAVDALFDRLGPTDALLVCGRRLPSVDTSSPSSRPANSEKYRHFPA